MATRIAHHELRMHACTGRAAPLCFFTDGVLDSAAADAQDHGRPAASLSRPASANGLPNQALADCRRNAATLRRPLPPRASEDESRFSCFDVTPNRKEHTKTPMRQAHPRWLSHRDPDDRPGRCQNKKPLPRFLQKALGAHEIMRFPGPDGSVMHAEIQIGNAILMLADENLPWAPAAPTRRSAARDQTSCYTSRMRTRVQQGRRGSEKVVSSLIGQFYGEPLGILDLPRTRSDRRVHIESTRNCSARRNEGKRAEAS